LGFCRFIFFHDQKGTQAETKALGYAPISIVTIIQSSLALHQMFDPTMCIHMTGNNGLAQSGC